MTVTRDTVEGYFKQKYGEIEKAVPEFAILQKRIAFSEQDRVGDYFNFPVFLTRSHGVTFNGVTTGTAFTLNDAVSAVSKNAQVQGTEFVLREKVAYGTLTAAQKAGPEAFGAIMTEVVMGMKESAAFYLEALMLYGQSSSGIGLVQAQSDDSGTSQSFQITKATWAPGLWAQMENAFVDVWSASYAGKRNSGGTMQVTAIDADNRIITCLGTEAEMDAIAATDIFVFRGHTASTTPTFECFAGLDKIGNNTGSLFNIDAATYNLWKSSTYDASGTSLTMGKIQAALTKAVVRGLQEDVQVLVSVYGWTDLNNDLSALRRYTEETKTEMTLGTNSICFYGANGGKLEIIPHAMMMAGQFKIQPFDRMKRIGSSDVTFKIPGATGQNANMFTELSDAAGAQLRCYADQAIILTSPAKAVAGSGIVNHSLPDAAVEYP